SLVVLDDARPRRVRLRARRRRGLARYAPRARDQQPDRRVRNGQRSVGGEVLDQRHPGGIRRARERDDHVLPDAAGPAAGVGVGNCRPKRVGPVDVLGFLMLRPLHVHGVSTPQGYRALQTAALAALATWHPRRAAQPWICLAPRTVYVAMGKW